MNPMGPIVSIEDEAFIPDHPANHSPVSHIHFFFGYFGD